ncbi:MAG: carboxypeptidase regulatory-like domain-containing protein [Terracidiphilus sp.]|jgi:hypothetical protein
MFRPLSNLVLSLMTLALLGGASAAAQNGGISGTVTDPQGKAISGAAVEVASQDGTLDRTTKSDASGTYSVADLPAGIYLVVVSVDGYNPFTSPPQTLAAGQALTFNPQIVSIKGESQSVTVVGGGPGKIELENATLSGTISSQQVVKLGLNGRNFSQLITTTAGVSNQTGQDEAKVGIAGSAKFSVNGGRVEYNTFMVDGSDVLNTGINASRGQGEPLIVYPSIDAIQDIQVLTSNYGAMYGKTASGTVLVTTKSGTAQFHGNTYGFVRNEDFNARNYFDQPVENAAGILVKRTPLYRRQDYGGTIGGPLFIPNKYNVKKDKTFFFFSEELRLEKTPVDYNQAVPTVAERSGDFSDVCPPNANLTATFYPNAGQYPDCPVLATDSTGKNPGFPYARANVNYLAGAMLNTQTIPLPNSSIGCNSTNPTLFAHCYDTAVSPATYWREELFRIDQNLSTSEQLSFRFIHDAWNTTTLTPQWGIVQNSFPTVENKLIGPGLDMVVNLTQTLPHAFLNRVTVAYSVSHISLAPEPGPGVTSLARPAILDDAGPSVTGGTAVSGAPDCSAVTGPAPTPPGMAQVLTECPMGHIFNNGFGGKMPGLVFQGNNGAYGGHGFAADTGYAPWNMSNPTYVLRDDVSKTIGKHTLQFGIEASLVQQNELSAVSGANSGDVQGLLTFSNQQSRNTSNNAFADFLAGPGIAPLFNLSGSNSQAEPGGLTTAIKTFQQDSGQGRYYDRFKVAELYVQDDWRATSRLTVNVGLRASLFGTWYNAQNTAYNWEPQVYNQSVGSSFSVDQNNGFLVENIAGGSGSGTGLSPVPLPPTGPYSLSNLNSAITNGLVQCGANSVPSSCMKSHVFNPAPRVGFAWDPFGNGRTSIRAGYGLFWEHGTSSEANTGSLIGGAPLILSETQSFPSPNGGSLASNNANVGAYNVLGFSCQDGTAQCGHESYPNGVTFPLNVTSIPTVAVYPYTQQWSLSVQRELGRDVVGTVAYVGSRGTHLTAERDINQLQPLPSSENPFPAGQPLTSDICQAGAVDGTFPVGGTLNGNGSTSSPGIGPNQPGYVNLSVACAGSPGFVSPNGAKLGISADTVRPYNGFSDILSISNIATSNYNGLQATIRRTKGSIALGAAYTYSHSLDDSSDRASANFVNSLDLKSSYASSDFDQRQLLSVDYIYQLPLIHLLYRFTNFEVEDDSAQAAPAQASQTKPAADWREFSLVKTLLDHWEFSGITAYQTGSPFSVINAGSANGIGAADNAGVGNSLGLGSYPDLVGKPRGVKPNGATSSSNFGPLLLNPSAFAAPRGLTFGNAGRNVLNNPARTNFNMSLLKTFPLSGERTIEFRTEVFNIFNHTQFRIYDPTHPGNTGNNVVNCYGDVTTGYNAGATTGATNCVAGNSFLHPVDAHDPRIMQFGLKLAF